MSENNNSQTSPDVKDVVRQAIEEFMRSQQASAEPVYKAELLEERRRREALEAKLNVFAEESKRSKQLAEEAERHSQIRSELQRFGVAKLDLAFRAVKDEIFRAEDGRLMARGSDGQRSLEEHLSHFVTENPELLPARMTGGTGVVPAHRTGPHGGQPGVDLDKIKPGMSQDDLDRVRQEISRLASQTLRGI